MITPYSVASTLISPSVVLWRSFFIYCHTKIKIIFGFNLTVYEKESVSDIFICHGNHQRFSEPQFGRALDKRWGGSCSPK